MVKKIKVAIFLALPFLMNIRLALADTYVGDPTDKYDKINGAIWWIGKGCQAAGAVSIIFGAWQLGMSFTNDDPGYRTKSLYFLACGVVLFWAPQIMQLLMNWNIIDPNTW